ncbi:unnamed protein product [Tenebrio molitor]|nr:unnamed protein product [Tenebrio molitor]
MAVLRGLKMEASHGWTISGLPRERAGYMRIEWWGLEA